MISCHVGPALNKDKKMQSFFIKIKHTFEMVKFSHSIFALPFALAALVFASHGHLSMKPVLLIILCMVLARNVAMAFNRLVDANFDAKNPRTAIRHLPQGLLTRKFVFLFILINAALFILATSFFNPLTLLLSPVALAIVCFYSLTKRWTHYTQLFLGFALGTAPIATWIALTGHISLFPCLLGFAVLCWVAGFDIIYATQDYDHDKHQEHYSMVVKMGIPNALLTSKILHILCVGTFILLGNLYALGFFYWITIGIIALALAIEQSMVKPHDLSRVNAAFFTVNGFVGILFLIGTLAEIYIR